MVRNHYLLLGIPPDASQRQIKKGYRTLAKRFHPDRNKGSEAAAELFRQISNAYRVLSDPKARARYDQQLKEQQAQTPVTPTRTDRESRQKFGKFLNSLLDALFGPLDQGIQPVETPAATTTRSPKAAKRPDFNFYYHLAAEKRGSDYNRGKDGIYRRAKKTHSRPSASGKR